MVAAGEEAIATCCAPRMRAETGPDSATNVAFPVAAGRRRCNTIRLKGGVGFVGTDRPQSRQTGRARRSISLENYLLEAQTVTNARFSEFVAQTGYLTEAESFGWPAVFVGMLPPGSVHRENV